MSERFSSRSQSRVWYDVKTNSPRFVLKHDAANHTQDVVMHPEVFGVDPAVFGELPAYYDYVGRILYAAMQAGWVRILIDARQPQTSSNIEGISTEHLRPALIWMNDFIGGIKSATAVIRTGPGDQEGTGYYITNPDDYHFFLKWGRFRVDWNGQEISAAAE